MLTNHFNYRDGNDYDDNDDSDDDDDDDYTHDGVIKWKHFPHY